MLLNLFLIWKPQDTVLCRGESSKTRHRRRRWRWRSSRTVVWDYFFFWKTRFWTKNYHKKGANQAKVQVFRRLEDSGGLEEVRDLTKKGIFQATSFHLAEVAAKVPARLGQERRWSAVLQVLKFALTSIEKTAKSSNCLSGSSAKENNATIGTRPCKKRSRSRGLELLFN